MKIKNKYLVIITLFFSLFAFVISFSAWFLTDGDMNLLSLQNKAKGLMGSTVDNTISFAFISNILVSVLSLVSPLTLACFTLKQRNQFDLMSRPLILSMFVFSVLVLSLSVAAIAETANLFNENWVLAHKK